MEKKYHGGLKHLLQLSFFIVFVLSSISLASEPQYNTSYSDTYIGTKTMENIVSELNLFQQYSGDKLESLTYWTNDFISKFNISSGDLTIKNILFATDTATSDIYMYISNASYPGNNDWDFLYIESIKLYTSMKFTWLKNWNYSGQNISYPTTQAYPSLRYVVNSNGWRNGSSISYTVSNYNNSFIYIDNAVPIIGTYAVEGYTQTYGYGGYLLSHYAGIVLAPTPTPVPSSSPVPGGGDYTQQLDNITWGILDTRDEIHNMRVDINQGLDEIQEAIPTSGEIKEAQIEATTEYWGDSGDLSGDEQEEILEAGITEIKDSVSGEINKQESLQMIHDYEDRLYNLFMNPNDFRIYWNEAKYQNVKLIPAGEINFSQMERDIPTVALIMTYVRTILNMILTINIIKSVWNLLMQFLGIHESEEEYNETDAEVIGIGTTAISGNNQKMLGG